MKKIAKYIGLSLALLTAVSCKDYLNINVDPSVPQTTDALNALPPILYQMAFGEVQDARFISRYIQNFTLNTSGGDDYERFGYAPGSDNMGAIWRAHYWSIGTNIDLVIADATAKQSYDIVGAAKAIRAWSWQTTVDYHGPIILKQAWEPNRYVFDYDTEDLVYAEVIRLCKDALSDLDRKDGVFRLKLNDPIYGGDIEKWKRFVNGILARNAHHLSNKSALYKPDDVIKYCDAAMQANTESFAVPFLGVASGDANYYGPLRNNFSQYRPTTMITKLVDGTTFGGIVDPRRAVMIAPSRDTVWRGLPIYTSDPNAANTTKRILNIWGLEPGTATGPGRWIFADKAPYYIMTASEIQFIKAEAAFRKGDKPTAFAAFKQGISLHMDFCGVTAANKTAYLTSVALPQAAADLKMSDIMQQKYVAMYGLGVIETWVDMRRFQYDPAIYTTFTTPVGTQFYPANNGLLAYRVRPRYNSEYVWNLKSLATFGADKADYHTYKPWFVNP